MKTWLKSNTYLSFPVAWSWKLFPCMSQSLEVDIEWIQNYSGTCYKVKWYSPDGPNVNARVSIQVITLMEMKYWLQLVIIVKVKTVISFFSRWIGAAIDCSSSLLLLIAVENSSPEHLSRSMEARWRMGRGLRCAKKLCFRHQGNTSFPFLSNS